MQSNGRLLAAARFGLSGASRATRSTLSTSYLSHVCQRCGRSVTPSSIPSTFVRNFARKSKQATDTQPNTPATRKRTAARITSSDNVKQPAADSNNKTSNETLMRLLAELPAADVPAAIAALHHRLATHKQHNTHAAQMAVRQGEVEAEEQVEEEGEEEEEEEDENEAEYAELRARLAAEGVVRTEAGEEILSMEEVERQLKEEDGVDDEEEEAEEEEADQLMHDNTQHRSTTSSASSRPSASTSTANTFWIQERGDGTVTVTEWPFGDDDDDSSDLADSYDLNMPSSATQQSAIVGQAIGGEKMSRADVLQLREKDLQEHFTKGSGKGGQKVNKTSNCVHLHHTPTGTIVKCHATRSLTDNRRIAREIMQGRLEELVLGPASKNAKRAAKIRKQKAKTRRRAAVKYGEGDEMEESSTTVGGTVMNQHNPSSRSSDDK